ncbi:MAG TPA: M20 family metallopeptidase [Glaciihabitans sp.]|nr:M20 family metallopeptidase [Glaciihabitans sp.]
MSDLVKIDSTSGTPGEGKALEFVAAWMRKHSPGRIEITRSQDGAPTALLACPESDRSDELLLFSAHVDTVPVGNLSVWLADPFGGVIKDGRMYGRGTSDMKSGLAAAMVAVAELLHAGAPVALAVSTGEELGCRGANDVSTLIAGLQVNAVIVPESTHNEVVLGHRGALWLSIATSGLAAHGSTPERGKNAIAAAMNLLGRLTELPLLEHPYLGHESVNIGAIHAGTVPNIVPDRCEFQVDIRVVNANLDRLVGWWKAQDEVADVDVMLNLAAVSTDVDHVWVQSLGAPIAQKPASYFTDASVLARNLSTGTPVVIWGPGDPDLVHTTRESVSLDALQQALEQYIRVGISHRTGVLPHSSFDGATDELTD